MLRNWGEEEERKTRGELVVWPRPALSGRVPSCLSDCCQLLWPPLRSPLQNSPSPLGSDLHLLERANDTVLVNDVSCPQTRHILPTDTAHPAHRPGLSHWGPSTSHSGVTRTPNMKRSSTLSELLTAIKTDRERQCCEGGVLKDCFFLGATISSSLFKLLWVPVTARLPAQVLAYSVAQGCCHEDRFCRCSVALGYYGFSSYRSLAFY